MLCIQYLSTGYAMADSGVKVDNLCIKRQTLRQSVEQRRPTAHADHRGGNGQYCCVAAAEDTVYSPEYVTASECSM